MVKVYLVNALTKDGNGGNPAGVVLESENMDAATMQKLANKVGVSETAFVQKSDKADFKVRFFTPTDEVDLCGHATIATFSTLFQKGIIKPGEYKQETLAGVLRIRVNSDGSILMDQTLPKFYKKLSKEVVASALNIDAGQINGTPQIVSTGLKDILVPIDSLKTISRMKPNMQKIKLLSKKYNTIGVHAFTLETKHTNSAAHCRNFAPLYGIDEESATGTSNGGLACYLYKHKLLKKQGTKLHFEQGYVMDRPSKIDVKLSLRNNKIVRVQVGGYVTALGTTTILYGNDA